MPQNGEIRLTNDSDAMQNGWMHQAISIRPTYSCAGLPTYLLTHLARANKTGNISETVEDKLRAKATINGVYKVVHWLSIAAKMYDLE